jgi:hypothetical protein
LEYSSESQTDFGSASLLLLGRVGRLISLTGSFRHSGVNGRAMCSCPSVSGDSSTFKKAVFGIIFVLDPVEMKEEKRETFSCFVIFRESTFSAVTERKEFVFLSILDFSILSAVRSLWGYCLSYQKTNQL